MTKLYVSGKWDDRGAVAELQRQAVAAGHTIVRDWVADTAVDEVVDLGAQLRICIQAVQDCDVLVVILTDPAYPYRGTITEATAALVLGKRVLLLLAVPSDCYAMESMAFHDATITTVATVADVLAAL